MGAEQQDRPPTHVDLDCFGDWCSEFPEPPDVTDPAVLDRLLVAWWAEIAEGAGADAGPRPDLRAMRDELVQETPMA